MAQKLNKKEYRIRLAVIILAVISPIILIITQGYLPSISSYWLTPMQPLFIFTNAVTSYHLFAMEKWRYSASLLLMLTAVSFDLSPMIHNLLAVLFFIVTLFPFFKSNHFKHLKLPWIYLLSLLVMPFSMITGEIIAITTLCVYHALILNKVYRLKNKS